MAADDLAHGRVAGAPRGRIARTDQAGIGSVKLSANRVAVLGTMGLRIVYGVGLLVAPAPLTRRWLGSAADTAPTQVPLRGLGTREAVLHAGAAVATSRGAAV